MAADFTYSMVGSPTPAALKPLFTFLLTHRERPKVSLGAVTRATANAWLTEMRDEYCLSIGTRSGLLKNMDMVARVEMVDLTDEPAPE